MEARNAEQNFIDFLGACNVLIVYYYFWACLFLIVTSSYNPWNKEKKWQKACGLILESKRDTSSFTALLYSQEREFQEKHRWKQTGKKGNSLSPLGQGGENRGSMASAWRELSLGNSLPSKSFSSWPQVMKTCRWICRALRKCRIVQSCAPVLFPSYITSPDSYPFTEVTSTIPSSPKPRTNSHCKFSMKATHFC